MDPLRLPWSERVLGGSERVLGGSLEGPGGVPGGGLGGVWKMNEICKIVKIRWKYV